MFGSFNGLFWFEVVGVLEGSMLLWCVRHYRLTAFSFEVFPTLTSITSGDDDLEEDFDPGRDDTNAPPPSGIGILDCVGIGLRTVGSVGTLKLSGEIIVPIFGLKVFKSLMTASFSFLASSEENPL